MKKHRISIYHYELNFPANVFYAADAKIEEDINKYLEELEEEYNEFEVINIDVKYINFEEKNFAAIVINCKYKP